MAGERFVLWAHEWYIVCYFANRNQQRHAVIIYFLKSEVPSILLTFGP